MNISFEVKSLGTIRAGRFTQKPLTVFCGPNNSGKTWAMYSLYYCHHLMKICAKDQEPKACDLGAFNRRAKHTLGTLFNARPDLLKGASVKMTGVGNDKFHGLLKKEGRKNTFLIPAERNGLNLFFRELSTRRTALLHHASRENIDLNELLRDVIHSRYATPIAHYIDWLNQLIEIQRGGPGDFHAFAEQIKRRIVRGAYRVNKTTGEITFKPYQGKHNGKGAKAMGLHIASGTAKSLFGLWFYLENQAKKGDLLMIDEPELNIHPENQLKIARLLARLVNAGLNVVISTHSTYIVREFNNLLMLNEDKDGNLKRNYKYDDEEVLCPSQVGAYLFDNQAIEPFKITSEDGIHATTFDQVIRELNEVNDGIYYDLEEQRMGRDDD